MEPVTPVGVSQAGPQPAATAVAPVQPVAPVVGASGPPAAAPAAAPAVTPPVVQPVAESPELAQIRAERARLEAELARITPYAAAGYKALQQQQPAAQPAAPAKTSLGVPELDPEVARWVTTDASGNYQEIPGAPPGTIAAFNAHQRARAAYIAKLVANPKDALGPLFEEYRAEAVEKAKQEVLAEQVKAQNARTAEYIVAQNSDWLFEKDAAGNKILVTDPLTGTTQYKRTEGGDWWYQAVNQLTQQGVTDPVQINEYAKAMTWFRAYQNSEAMKAQMQQPATQPVAPAPQAAPDLKAAFLSRIPGAAPGSVQPPASSVMPNQRRLTTGEAMRQAMMEGLTQAGYAPGSRLPMGTAA